MQVNESTFTSYKLAFLGCYKRREIGNVMGLNLFCVNTDLLVNFLNLSFKNVCMYYKKS